MHRIPHRVLSRTFRSARPRPSAFSLASSLVLLAAAALFAAPSVASSRPSFDDWLQEVRQEALQRGISSSTVESALGDLTPEPRVLKQDRNQPGKPQDFCSYMERRLTSARIARAKQMLEEHAALLEELNAIYGVPPRYLVSLWGLESNFGDHQGDYSVIRSLATLAHDPRRSATFRRQLFAALEILDAGHLTAEQMEGSWAGAMGQVQFMPTTFLAYAVDRDGDGRKDIWSSVPDALASAANYLSHAGWRRGESWGRPVQIPDGLSLPGRTSPAKSLAEWSRDGVVRYDGGALPSARMRGSIVLPMKRPKPAFLVYRNYQTILNWNQSTFFGISVGTLADRMADLGEYEVCGIDS